MIAAVNYYSLKTSIHALPLNIPPVTSSSFFLLPKKYNFATVGEFGHSELVVGCKLGYVFGVR